MTSNDSQQYINVELFNAKIDTLITQIQLDNEKLRNELKNEIQGVRSDLHYEIQSGRSELHNEIQVLQSDVRVNSAQIAELHHFIYWGIAILALIATAVPFLRHERKEKIQENKTEQNHTVLTEQKVQDMINHALSNLNSGGKVTM